MGQGNEELFEKNLSKEEKVTGTEKAKQQEPEALVKQRAMRRKCHSHREIQAVRP